MTVEGSGSEELRRRRAASERYLERARQRDAQDLAGKPLAERLRSKSDGVRYRSLQEAAAQGQAGQVLLVDLLHDVTDPGYQFQILPLLEDPSAAGVIQTILDNEKSQEKADLVCACLSALGRVLGSEGMPLVAPYLFDKRWAVREQACRVVARDGTATIQDQVYTHWRGTLRAVLRRGERAMHETAVILLYWARLAQDKGPQAVTDVTIDLQKRVWPKFVEFVNNGEPSAQAPGLVKNILRYWPESVKGDLAAPETLAPKPELVDAWRRGTPG